MRKRRSLVVLVVGAAVVIGAFLGLLLRSSDDSAAPQLHGARITLVPAARRKPLPDLGGPALTPPPATIRLGALRGRPALIDVWASWCVPCREEAPMIARLWRRYGGQVRFLGIDVEDSRGDARAFVRRYGLRYPSIFDKRARSSCRGGQRCRLTACHRGRASRSSRALSSSFFRAKAVRQRASRPACSRRTRTPP